jgi:hypothetical protein
VVIGGAGALGQRRDIDHAQQRIRDLLDQDDVGLDRLDRRVDRPQVAHIAVGHRDLLRGEEVLQQRRRRAVEVAGGQHGADIRVRGAARRASGQQGGVERGHPRAEGHRPGAALGHRHDLLQRGQGRVAVAGVHVALAGGEGIIERGGAPVDIGRAGVDRRGGRQPVRRRGPLTLVDQARQQAPGRRCFVWHGTVSSRMS